MYHPLCANLHLLTPFNSVHPPSPCSNAYRTCRGVARPSAGKMEECRSVAASDALTIFMWDAGEMLPCGSRCASGEWYFQTQAFGPAASFLNPSKSSESLPPHIYKLITSSAPLPNPLLAHLPLSALDESSGFIHLSTAAQVASTHCHFFASDPKLYVLRIPYLSSREGYPVGNPGRQSMRTETWRRPISAFE